MITSTICKMTGGCGVQSVEGMKLVCYELMDAANRSSGADALQLYADSANDLVIQLTSKIEKVGQFRSFAEPALLLHVWSRRPDSCKISHRYLVLRVWTLRMNIRPLGINGAANTL